MTKQSISDFLKSTETAIRHQPQPPRVKGYRRRNSSFKRIVCDIYPAMFDEIRDKAAANGISYAEQVRRLLAEGLRQ